MKPTLIALTLTTLSVFWGPAAGYAADSRTARGTIASIAGQSVVVKVADHDMTFSVDQKTIVTARGASSKSARAALAGRSGVHLDEVLQLGEAVAVTYHDMGSALMAIEIKAIPKSAAAAAPEKTTMISAGVVKSMGADWITITGHGGGGASFEQTFKIDTGTKVFEKGASTAAKDGKASFSMLVANGDHVSVSYRKLGTSLLASNVRVTTKVTH